MTDADWISILGVLCIFSGIIMVCQPEKVWRMQHFLSVRDGEPTKLYLVFCRISGVVAACFGAAAVLYSFF